MTTNGYEPHELAKKPDRLLRAIGSVVIFAVIGGLVYFGMRETKPHSWRSIEELIELLRRPGNRVPENYSGVIPGGEILEFSDPLRELMKRGGKLANHSSRCWMM